MEGDGLRVLRSGSICFYSFEQLVMSLRVSHRSTTTCFLLNLSGVDLSTPMAYLDETYLLIFTWSILIICVKMQLATYVGANNTTKAIVRSAKSVQSMSDALHHFDNENGIDNGPGAHTQRSEVGVLSKIINEIHKKRCFHKRIRTQVI